MNEVALPAVDMRRAQGVALAVGLAGVVASVVGVALEAERFFQAYLVAYLFWAGLALGCLALLMVHELVGGAWSLALSRVLEAGASTMPLVALLVLPVLMGVRELYPWARPEVVAEEPSLERRETYLNIPFFFVRSLVYVGVWVALAYFMRQWATARDLTGDPVWTVRLRRLSAGGLVVLALTVTFALIDWVMTLEVSWASSIYPAMVGGSALLAALALAVGAVLLLATRPALAGRLAPRVRGDMGGVFIGFAILWTYLAYSQLLLVWAGNLPDEVRWYVRRTEDGWQWLAWVVAAGQFVLPVALLVSRRLRLDARVLGVAVGVVLAAHAVDTFWLVAPAFEAEIGVHWLHVATWAGVGGLWLALASLRLAERGLVLP